MKTIVYTADRREEWDRFIEGSRNGTFHLQRAFVEYHADRFNDCSLMVYNDQNELMLVSAMHRTDSEVATHRGLTYGGFVLSREHRIEEQLDAMRCACMHLVELGAERLFYKTIPHLYHRVPCEDDLFFLYHVNAQLVGRNISPVIAQHDRIAFQERRKRAVKKALKEGVTVGLSDDLESYWNIITALLANYNSKPVHSLGEIVQLKNAFPENIQLHAALLQGEMVAGVLIFESHTVAKMQYIAASPKGKDLGALDAVMDHLINSAFVHKPYIDFGTSTAHGGGSISFGISQQKEGFGARTSVHDHYMIDLKQVAAKDWSGLIAAQG
jgi:Acetyltransferase (GNAT) domain